MKKKYSHNLVFFSLIVLVSLVLISVSATQAAPNNVVCYVKYDASGTGLGTSWTDAYSGASGVQDALADLGNSNCTQIWVAANIYRPGSNRYATFQLVNGVALYGGFAGTEVYLNDRDILANPTILSGDIGTLDTYTDNVYHVVTGSGTDNTAVLDGFTVAYGYADGTSPANKGGGMYTSSGNPTVRNVTFRDNYASSGGGMYNSNSTSAISGVLFEDNESAYGGGMYNGMSNVTLTNITFVGNSAGSGAGMYNSYSNPSLNHLTFNANSATSYGGGIFNENSRPTITNSIFWGNTHSLLYNQIFDEAPSSTIISDSVVHEGFAGGTNIITDDPLLGALGSYTGRMKVIPVAYNSPAVDAGGSANCAIVDQRGLSRSGLGTSCDIGAYEFLPVMYANYLVGRTTGFCHSWSFACDLQYALKSSVAGQQIWVATGLYLPGTQRTDTFQLKNGVALYGGFLGTETSLDERDPEYAYNTALSGNIGGFNDDDDNVYHVVTGSGTDSSAILDGFSIIRGNANGTPPDNYGGGMYIENGNPTVRNIVFKYNYAKTGGGGMLTNNSTAAISNVLFIDNTSVNGGGMYNYQSDIVLTNATFTKNDATNSGGGILNHEGSPTFNHLTVHDNLASILGGGMYNMSASTPTVTNSIFWGDSAPTGNEIYDYSGSSSTVSDSIVEGGFAGGSSIITANPYLQLEDDPSKRGGYTQVLAIYHPDSPAIDAANNANCPATDQRGLSRPQGAGCDIGAFEFQDVVFASPGGLTGGFCNSWDSACELSYALPYSYAYDQEIWAKEGTYITTDGSDRSVSFMLERDRKLYGGFDGTETSRNQRDWENNPTILSGEINTSAADDNSYHVVKNATTCLELNNEIITTLDGFTITGGYANSGDEDSDGGGLYNDSHGCLIVRNMVFDSNHANSIGGGIVNSAYGEVELENVSFTNNFAAAGAGLYNHGIATLTNTTFTLNTALNSGGGMAVSGNEGTISTHLTNVTFSENTATNHQGGGLSFSSGEGVFSKVTFDRNIAGKDGGGIKIYVDEDLTMTDINFIQNEAGVGDTGYGGGMYFVNNATAAETSLTNFTFVSNQADYGGGLYYSYHPQNEYLLTLLMSNATFVGNTANIGGGIYVPYAVGAMYNLTLQNNVSTLDRGHSLDFGESGDGNFIIADSIIWGDEASNQLEYDSWFGIRYSVVKGGYVGGTNIITDDPLLGTSGDNGGFTETVPLLEGSPAIDGAESCLLDKDQRGMTRPQGDGCDIGAYEARLYTLYVSQDGSGSGTVTGDGISCGGDCTENYVENTEVTLTASPDSGSVFAGWGGACFGTGSCVVAMDQVRTVTATFDSVPPGEFALHVNLAGNGSGTVTGNGINCFVGAGADCTETYTEGTQVTLTANPQIGSSFEGWSGACTGSGSCVLTMNSAKPVTATFESGATNTQYIFLPLVIK